MSDIVSPLLQWLNAHPELAGLVTFTISAAESVAIIGTVVPGSIMMTALGTLAGAGIIPLWETILWAILGAIVGDGISYWLGYYFKDRLPNIWPFRRYPQLLQTGERFFLKYGSMSVFIGRFVGPVRALVPLVAGMLGMPPLRFILANVTSAIGWAPAYMLPGILIGAASLELPPDIAMHVIIVLLLILLFIMLSMWFIFITLQLVHNQINQMQNWIWHKLKATRYLSPITVLLKHHEAGKSYGQLNLAFFFLLTSILFLLLAHYVVLASPSAIMVNDAIFHLFRGIRTPLVDTIMINITLLGQKEVILPVILALFAWLIYLKRWRSAFHALALVILGAGGVFVIKHWLQSPRPWGIFQSPETFSMPSGHVTLATIVYLGLAFLFARSFRSKNRWMIYLTSILIILAVTTSRLYLGAHWFTDILAAWLLSIAVLTVVAVSYHRKNEKPIPVMGMLLVCLLSLVVSFSLYHHRHFNDLKRNYEQINWPTAEISMSDWWQKNDMLPAYQASLFGFPSTRINLEWVGNLDTIREALIKEGWSKPPARDFISTLHRISDVQSTEYLPLVSLQYVDKKPALILTRRVNGGKNLLVVRLWDSMRVIKESGATVWVGIIGDVPRTYSWIFKKNASANLDIDPMLVFPNKTGIREWQWKIITLDQPAGGKTIVKQRILLVRQNKFIHKKK